MKWTASLTPKKEPVHLAPLWKLESSGMDRWMEADWVRPGPGVGEARCRRSDSGKWSNWDGKSGGGVVKHMVEKKLGERKKHCTDS